MHRAQACPASKPLAAASSQCPWQTSYNGRQCGGESRFTFLDRRDIRIEDDVPVRVRIGLQRNFDADAWYLLLFASSLGQHREFFERKRQRCCKGANADVAPANGYPWDEFVDQTVSRMVCADSRKYARPCSAESGDCQRRDVAKDKIAQRKRNRGARRKNWK